MGTQNINMQLRETFPRSSVQTIHQGGYRTTEAMVTCDFTGPRRLRAPPRARWGRADLYLQHPGARGAQVGRAYWRRGSSLAARPGRRLSMPSAARRRLPRPAGLGAGARNALRDAPAPTRGRCARPRLPGLPALSRRGPCSPASPRACTQAFVP